ncbi:MAG: hypothetical protein EXQ70_07155 [Solirubrobacterales bacterium]|nr:hypothetical protein [Solirubrobacterales bacterium]
MAIKQSPRPLLFSAGVLLIIVSFLGLDHYASLGQQFAIGAMTWGALIFACMPLDPRERARVAIVVIVATGAEVLGSIIFGVYTYRLENLPAFVPPGHGLVYLAGLRISQSALVKEHQRAFVGGVIALIAAWGIAGWALLGRTDALGAIAGALLIVVLLRAKAPTIYAGVFLVVAFLEIYGTGIGAWHWAETVPGTTMQAGNPPSGIAGIYVLFDVAAIAMAPRLLNALAAARGMVPRLARTWL